MGQIRRRLYQILEDPPVGDKSSDYFALFMTMLILINIAAVVLETVDWINAQYATLIRWIEVISVIIFTIEYMVRLWVSVEDPLLQKNTPLVARFRFSLTPFAIIDLLAILPFFFASLLPVDLRILRIFRLLRVLKLARYSPALTTIARVFYLERRALGGALVIMIDLLLLSSTFVYFAEREAQPVKFANIPQAMWWALATLTTVGYGDVVPITSIGKIIGSFVMLFGLGAFALPIGILANGFAEEIHRRDFVINWGMVAKVPIFHDLPANTIIEIARLLHAKKLPADYVLARPGDAATCMYFIVRGEVELEFSARKQIHQLAAGDYFGELSLLRDTTRKATMTIRTDCRLLVLESQDFHRLMNNNPSIRDHIHTTAAAREDYMNQNVPEHK